MEFSMKDSYRAAIEAASGGKNTVMYDDYGNPNIMVLISKFDMTPFGIPMGGRHPAFVMDEKGMGPSEIWVSKYLASKGNGGCGASIPMADPWNAISFDKAKEACRKQGKGWHLMTNLEWSAIMLLSWKLGALPVTTKPLDLNEKQRVMSDKYTVTNQIKPEKNYSLGWGYKTSPAPMENSTTHDQNGIFDMVGNLWQYVDGIQLGPDFERICYWRDDNDMPINDFENGVIRPPKYEVTLDWTAGVIPTTENRINMDRARQTPNSNGGMRCDFKSIATYEPQIAINSKYHNIARALMLVPPKDCGDEIVGGVVVPRLNAGDGPKMLIRGGSPASRVADSVVHGPFEYTFECGFEDTHLDFGFRSVYISPTDRCL